MEELENLQKALLEIRVEFLITDTNPHTPRTPKYDLQVKEAIALVEQSEALRKRVEAALESKLFN